LLTAPDAINTFNRSRESEGIAAASARSSRQPSESAGTRASMLETPEIIR
jgi:hypothetical protein